MRSIDGWDRSIVTPIKMSLWEIFPVPLSQNKESKAETNSGGLISQKQIIPSQRTSAICLKIWSISPLE